MGGKGDMPSKFLTYFDVLCFEKRCPKQNRLLFKVKIFGLSQNFALATLLILMTDFEVNG